MSRTAGYYINNKEPKQFWAVFLMTHELYIVCTDVFEFTPRKMSQLQYFYDWRENKFQSKNDVTRAKNANFKRRRI